MYRKISLSDVWKKLTTKFQPIWSKPHLIIIFLLPVPAELKFPITGKLVRSVNLLLLNNIFNAKKLDLPLEPAENLSDIKSISP